MAQPDAVTLQSGATLFHATDEPVRLTVGGTGGPSNAPLVECFTLESGRAFVDHRLSRSAQGEALRPTAEWLTAAEPEADGWRAWEVRQADPLTGLEVVTRLAAPAGSRSLRVRSTLRNAGDRPIHLTAVSLLSATLLPGSDIADVDVLHGRSGWMAEGRWSRGPLEDYLADITPDLHGESARDCFRLSAESGWSSSRWAPVGFVEDRSTGESVAWQVEHNGAWTVELSRRTHSLALAAYGPTDLQHHWLRKLEPGDEFVTPTVAVAWGDAGWESALGELTTYRRALRVASGREVAAAPIVYNDYLNTIMADPTTAKLRPLIAAAAELGAEVFCIDAGWFADELGADWWETVGEWLPSTTRFEGGLEGLLQEIRDHGLVPGLWIEPMALGLRARNVQELAPATMTRAGVAIVEQGRLRLDMRHPMAREHLDRVLDRMVGYGIGYLKIDDNFSVGSGPDAAADSPGDGLLEHQREWAGWLERLGRRHPDLVIENCGSGGMTSDYALLAHTHLQSTSDLQDMVKYSTIAAAAPTVVLPEQTANWAVPELGMELGEVVSTLVTSLAGSLYLSGKLHELDAPRRELVEQAVAFARRERDAMPTRIPHWPAGLPGWTDPWVALALVPAPGTGSDGLLFVWHRAGAMDTTLELSTRDRFLGWELGEQLFPTAETTDVQWDITTDETAVRFAVPASSTTARIFRIGNVNTRDANEGARTEES